MNGVMTIQVLLVVLKSGWSWHDRIGTERVIISFNFSFLFFLFFFFLLVLPLL